MSTSEDIYCFVHFLKCLLNIDPKSRFTASQCLHHPFITKEKFDSFVLGSNNHFPLEENTSQPYLYLSNTNINPNLNNQRMNNSFNSMVYNVPMNNSMSFEGPNNSSYCFQPNLNNIHMNWMRNFPFAMVDQCNLKGSPQPNNYNKTFMMTSFEKLNMNNSYTNMNNSNSFIYNSNNMNSNGTFSNEFTNAKMRGRQKSLFSTNLANNVGNRNSIGTGGNLNYNFGGGGGMQQQFMRRSNKKGKTLQYSTLWSNARNNMNINNQNNDTYNNFIFINNNNNNSLINIFK